MHALQLCYSIDQREKPREPCEMEHLVDLSSKPQFNLIL